MASLSGRGIGSRISVDVGVGTGDTRLKANALTLWDSTVRAVTSTAPTYSMASTMFLMAATCAPYDHIPAYAPEGMGTVGCWHGSCNVKGLLGAC